MKKEGEDKKELNIYKNNELYSLSSNLIERNCGSPLEFANDDRNELETTLNTQLNPTAVTANHFISLKPCNQVIHDSAPVYFFDLDNTIYPKSSGIDELMAKRIEMFFIINLKLPKEESQILGARFYRDYGLAIKGLIKHFSIDPLEYDRFVDGGLPLDEILKPSPNLKNLLNRLSQKGSCWIFTNAGKSHALRVLSLLEIKSFFSGVIYCDYSEENFPAKPDRLAFTRAMKCAGVDDPKRCYFFDDSITNIRTAQVIGWNVVYINEDSLDHSVSASTGEINAQMDILVDCGKNESVILFPTVRFIEEVEQVLL